MDKRMNITLNKLPARTWNQLHMNEAVVENVEMPIVRAGGQTAEKESDIQLSAGLNMHLADEEEKRLFDNVETALGKDMDTLGADVPVEVIACTDQEHAKGQAVLWMNADGQYGRYLLHLKKNSQMQVAVYGTSDGKEAAPLFLQLKIYAEENAKLDLTVVQTVDKTQQVFSDIGGILEKNAVVNLVKMELGGKDVYAGAYMNLKGDRSSFQAHIGYLGEKNQHLDMNYVARHYGKKTQSLMESSGVLKDEAFKLFRGTIDFVKGCAGSVGNEKEDALLLGEDVVNQTIPLILCAEEDVEGNHGASIGELDDKTLFYLMSRGFSEEAAVKMIAQARLEAVAAWITEESVRKTTIKFLEERS